MSSSTLLVKRLIPVGANAIIVFFALAIYSNDAIPFFYFLSDRTLQILSYAAGIYVAGHAGLALWRGTGVSKGQHLLRLLRKTVSGRHTAINGEERLAALTVLVKLYFIPVMVNFLLFNHQDVYAYIITLSEQPLTQLFSIQGFNLLFYPFLFSVLLLIDVSYFVYGYIVDHHAIGSPIKSVEPTALGWLVTLMCYPPFNTTTTDMIGWYAKDGGMLYGSASMVFAINVLALILFAMYVWATVALGSKCSNLTNRGIVARGPYAYVRHPAYAAKNAVWIISVIPLFSFAAFLSVTLWATIYYLRAFTEERHLSHDPDYIQYKQRVRYQFIPGIW